MSLALFDHFKKLKKVVDRKMLPFGQYVFTASKFTLIPGTLCLGLSHAVNEQRRLQNC